MSGLAKNHGCALIGMACFLATGFQGVRRDPTGWSLDEWLSWRDRQIATILEPTFESDGHRYLSSLDVSARSKAADQVIEYCLAEDPAYFTRDSGRNHLLGHFIEFIRAQSWSANRDPAGLPTNALGLSIRDADYAKEVERSVSIPDLLQSQPFLRLMSSPGGYERAVRLIEEENKRLPEDARWKSIFFESHFLKSADQSTYGRLLVMVPELERRMDLWFNFAIVTPGMPAGTAVKTVSLVAVPKDQPGRCLILDFFRDENPSTGEIGLIPAVEKHTDPNDRCYDCHKSPVLPIHPAKEFKFDGRGGLVPASERSPTVTELNDLIAKYPKGWFLGADPGAFGPCMGDARDRSDVFILAASGEPLSLESIARVRKEMRCASCHASFGTLNYPSALTSSRDIHALRDKTCVAETYVENGWMPPNNDLTSVERRALWKCLSKEYFDPDSETGRLVDWLKGGD